MLKRAPILLICLLPLIGCGVGEGDGPTPPWHQAPTPTADVPQADAVPEEPVEHIPAYNVKLETTKGDVVLAIQPDWAPRAAIRFKELVEAGYFDDNRIFRVVPDFVVQFGMHGDPDVNSEWQGKPIKDDKVQVSNDRGTVTFATSGPNARTTQIFINLKDNPQLDTMAGSFAPFARVVDGMEVVESFNSEHGGAPSENQGKIAEQGNAYLDKAFPGLDSIVKATLIETPTEPSLADEKSDDEHAADEAASAKNGAVKEGADEKADKEKPTTESPAEKADTKDAPADEPAAEDGKETPAEKPADKDAAAPDEPATTDDDAPNESPADETAK